MHFADPKIGMMGTNGVVGPSMALACGAAFAHKRAGDGNVAVAFFGDGATNEGIFHESMNLAAVEKLEDRFDHTLDLMFIESGGDNLAATFSPELVDFSIYIIDCAEGEKIPEKAGQGMIKSDLFIINKIDLAPYVGANLEHMRETSKKFRGDGKFVFTNLKTDDGLEDVVDWIRKDCMLEDLEA